MSSKPVLAIDCDDVLLHYVPAVVEWHNQVYATQLTLNDFTSFQFSRIWGGDNDGTVEKVKRFSETEEYEQLQCIEGAKQALEELSKYYELNVVTARFPDRAEITQRWIDTNFPGLIHKIYYTFDKATACQQLNAYALIDDSVSNIAKCQQVVTKSILFDHNQTYLWNKDVSNLDSKKFVRAHSWKEIVDILAPPAQQTIHTSSLNSPWFELVKQNKKIYEGRCNWKKVKTYQVGDIIEFHHHTEEKEVPIQKEIVNVLAFPSFEIALKTLSLEEVLPGVKTIEEGINIYYQYVSKETQQANGIVMIQLSKA